MVHEGSAIDSLIAGKSPWSFEAGAIDTLVVGLTLTYPNDGNHEIAVQDRAIEIDRTCSKSRT